MAVLYRSRICCSKLFPCLDETPTNCGNNQSLELTQQTQVFKTQALLCFYIRFQTISKPLNCITNDAQQNQAYFLINIPPSLPSPFLKMKKVNNSLIYSSCTLESIFLKTTKTNNNNNSKGKQQISFN